MKRYLAKYFGGLGVAVGLALGGVAQAQTTLWIDSSGGSLLDSSNWSAGLPGVAVDGVFALPNSYTVGVESDYAVKNLYVTSGTTTVDVAAGKTLSLTNGGLFFVQAGAGILSGSGGVVSSGGVGSYGSLTINVAQLQTAGVGVDLGGSATVAGSLVQAGSVAVGTGLISQTSGTIQSAELIAGSGSGAIGRYQISGGRLTVTGSDASLRVGDFTGSGTMTQTGGLVEVIASSPDGASLNIGNQGGTGFYNLSSGTLAFTGPGLVTLGRSADANAAGRGTLNISGNALMDVSGGSGSALFIVGDNVTSANNGVGTVNQTGGTVRVRDGANLYLSGFAPSISGTNTYNLTGGVLEIGGSALRGVYNGSSQYAFNLGGGTIRVSGTNLDTSVNASLNNGTADIGPASKIDTNGFNAIWRGNFSGTGGGLIKTGSGTLTLSGTVNRTAGYFNADQGTVVHASGTTTSAEFVVGSNYAAKNGAFVHTGGVLNVSGSTPASPAPSMRIGDFSGTGTFTQSGGVVNADGALLLGNRGGDGTYTLTSGTLNVGQTAIAGTTALIMGRSRVADTLPSRGVLNVDGGYLHLFSSAALLVGGEESSTATASGVVNQNGNSLVRAEKFIVLGQTGTGTYNLNSGTLQVGGANGIRKGSGSATFNLAGGTLDIINANFSSTVPVTVSGSASRINTNALSATFTGGLKGSGLVTKRGSGGLVVGGVSSADILVEEGQLSGTGSTSGDIRMGAGTTLSGAINSAGTIHIAQGATYSPGFSPIASYSEGNLDLDGTLLIEIGGDAAGTGTFTSPVTGQFDQVLQGGGITIGDDAVIQIASLNSYLPAYGDTFNILLAGGVITGDFNLITVQGLGDLAGYQFSLALITTSWNGSGSYNTLQLTTLPEPSTALLAGAGIVTLLFRRRR